MPGNQCHCEPAHIEVSSIDGRHIDLKIHERQTPAGNCSPDGLHEFSKSFLFVSVVRVFPPSHKSIINMSTISQHITMPLHFNTHTHTHTRREKTNLPPVGIGIGTTGISVSDCTPVQYKYLQLKPFPYFVTDTSPHYKTHATVARFSNTFSKPVLLDRERMLQIGHCGDIIHWCVFPSVCVNVTSCFSGHSLVKINGGLARDTQGEM